jgi:glycine/D-amino acid oxidase-like deaminating enzyme
MESQARTVDIAIIGGGIIGMSCAYELSQQSNLRIALFDKANPASGTTGGSAGVICLHDMGEIYAQLTILAMRASASYSVNMAFNTIRGARWG